MEYDAKKIEERIKSLPDDLQEAMISVNVADKILDIAEENGLYIEQAGKLSDLTSYIMLGFIPTNKFVSELSKRTEIDSTKAGLIAQEINDKIFNDIRASLQQIQANEKKQEDEAMVRANTLKGIENPSVLVQAAASPQSVNLLTEYPAIIQGQEAKTVPSPIQPIPPAMNSAETPTLNTTQTPAAQTPQVKSINLLDQFMSAPVTTKNPQAVAQTTVNKSPSNTSDPYREPIA